MVLPAVAQAGDIGNQLLSLSVHKLEHDLPFDLKQTSLTVLTSVVRLFYIHIACL